MTLGIVGFGYFFWTSVERDRQLYPAQITIVSRPGAAIIVPFSRRLERAQKSILNVIDGNAITEPNPLPGGLSLIHSEVNFRSSGATGDILIWLPPEASGEIKFSITASADAGAAGVGAARLYSDSAAVTLKVAGAPVAVAEPDFSGEWSDHEQQWSFAANGGDKELTIKDADGVRNMEYDLYPDQNGRWFLAEIEPVRPRVYWIDVEGDLLKVALPGKEFKPFAELRRSGA